jgi:hypothetical protein
MQALWDQDVAAGLRCACSQGPTTILSAGWWASPICWALPICGFGQRIDPDPFDAALEQQLAAAAMTCWRFLACATWRHASSVLSRSNLYPN